MTTLAETMDTIARRCIHGIGIRHDDHYGFIVFELPDPMARPHLEEIVMDPTRVMPEKYGPWPIVISRPTVDEALTAFAAALPEVV